MKFLLYVAVAALVSSAQCLVIRNAHEDSAEKHGSDKVRVVQSAPVLSSPVSSDVEPPKIPGIGDYAAKLLKELREMLERYGIHLPVDLVEFPGVHGLPSISGLLGLLQVPGLHGLPGVPRVSKRNIANMSPIGGELMDNLGHTGENVIGGFIPKFGKRDLTGMFPASGGGLIDDLVNKGQAFVSDFIPKGKRDIGSLIPFGGGVVSGMVNGAEDMVGKFIPKFGKRDLTGMFPASGGGLIDDLVNKGQAFVSDFIPKGKRDIGSLIPFGGGVVSGMVHGAEDMVGKFIPKFGKRDIGSLIPFGGDVVSGMVHGAEDMVGKFIPKFGKRDIGSLIPFGGGLVSTMVNKGEDMMGAFIPKFGKREAEERQKRELVMDGIEAINDNLFKPAMQTGLNMGNRFVKVLLQPISE